MGAISSGAKVNIIRLTHAAGVSTARLLPSDDITALMRNPMLRSVGVISGLFYNHIIVGEGDADRALYQEINERLLEADDPRGINNTLFLNANGKSTIPDIVAPLRKLGIPAACIVDVDVLKNGGEEFSKLVKACGLPTSDIQPYGTRRANTHNAMKSLHEDYEKQGGVRILGGQERAAADSFIEDLARLGLFIVPHGEVENWFEYLDISRSKHGHSGWLRTIFERLGSNSSVSEYVVPCTGDIWGFLGAIREWMANPNRKGIPA